MEQTLLNSLARRPVVLLLGPSQVGKTTLVQAMARSTHPARYLTLDDLHVRDAALTNPEGLIREQAQSPLILDEVQWAPGLLRAIKSTVDREPSAGRFLLTASTALDTVAGSWCDQLEVHQLYPLSWSEVLGQQPSDILDLLFSSKTPSEILDGLPWAAGAEDTNEIRDLLLGGGLPVPALMDREPDRRSWFEGYRQELIERDVRNLANLQRVPDFNRLLTAVAQLTSQTLNMSNLARDMDRPVTTVKRYCTLLEQTLQIGHLGACSKQGVQGLVKKPKLYFQDTGVACHLAGIHCWEDLDRRGRVDGWVETWTHGQLKEMISRAPNTSLTYWRVQPNAQEVNFLLQRGADAIGIQVTWRASYNRRDLVGLSLCRQRWQGRWKRSVLLYGGTVPAVLDDRTLVLPFRMFFRKE